MNRFILQFTRSILVNHKAWKQNLLTASRIRLFHHHSNLVLLQKNNTSILISSLSTTSKTVFKTPYNKKFIAFHESLDSKNIDFTMTNSDWEKLEEDILEESPNFVSHLDYSIMKSLSSRPDLSLSFYHYIKSKREPNVSTTIEFIINGAGKYDDLILEEVDNLTKNCDSIAFKVICWKVAFGVAKTKHWRQAVNYMNIDQESCLYAEVPAFVIRTLALVSKNSLIYQDYKIFHEVSRKFLPLLLNADDREVISQTFFHCWKNGFIPTDLFMELLKLGELPLEQDEINILQTHCNNEWEQCESAKLWKVQAKSRICHGCGETVPEIEQIDESVLIKIFNETTQMLKGFLRKEETATELQKLSDLLKTQKKQFDYVIDAANVGNFYLNKILWNLKKQNKHVLVVIAGSKRHCFNLSKGLATFLFLRKGSHDDIYLLLAALMSGPRCYIVTNDDLRDHIAKVDLELRQNFYAWRDRQRVFHVNEKLLHPHSYKWTLHESDSGWHVPCKEEDKEKDTYNPQALLLELQARRFLCVRKLSYVPSPELVSFRQAAKSQTVTNCELS